MTVDSPRIRLRIIAMVCVSLVGVLLARLWYLTVLTGQELQQKAELNVTSVVYEQAPRGRILDVNGRVLVDSRVVTVLTADRSEFDRRYVPGSPARTDVLTRIATELSRTGTLTKVSDLEDRLADKQYGPHEQVPLAFDVAPELLVYFGERADQFPGMQVTQRTVRSYPYGTRAAHILGYVGRISDTEYKARLDRKNQGVEAKPYDRNDDIGKTGIEAMFEDDLRGVPGKRVMEIDRTGRAVRERGDLSTLPRAGSDVWLTIDIDKQIVVEDELRAALEKARTQKKVNPTDPDITAPAGASVVLDPRNGNIVAMASYPTFDPAEFVGGISAKRYAELQDPSSFRPLFNRATQGEYAPGSTFKLFTAYAAITSGIMGTGSLPGIDQKIYDNGVFKLDKCGKDSPGTRCEWTNATGDNLKPAEYPGVDLPRSLAVSSDTYYYNIGASFDQNEGVTNRRAIQDAAEAFGLGADTGVTLPQEAAGFMPDRQKKQARHNENPAAFPEGRWFTGDNINLAVGQGDVLVTPLQLVNAYAAFGNGGTLYAPNLVSKVTAPDAKVVRSFDPRVRRQLALDPLARDRIERGLVDVTLSKDGTAFAAFHKNEGGVDFDLQKWPVLGKTGTAEVKGKADTSWFVAATPAATSARPDTAANQPSLAMVTILEESGFGGKNAAPEVATVLDKLLRGDVERHLSAPEREACQERLAKQAAAPPSSTGVTTSTTTTTTIRGATTTTAKPALPTLAELCGVRR